MKIHLLSTLLFIVTLTGCSSLLSNDARCPFKEEGGCQSVSEINHLVSAHRFTANGHYVQPSHPPIRNAITPNDVEPQGKNSPVWFNHWQDQSGNHYPAVTLEMPLGETRAHHA